MIDYFQALRSNLYAHAPVVFERLRALPLGLHMPSNLDYLTLEDDPHGEVVSLEEGSPQGSVPEIKVRNRARRPVFIPEGSTLLGAKQNRVVNLSVLLPPETVTVIPVSCVERGRWATRSHQFGLGAFADGTLRQMMCSGSTASLRSSRKVHVDQARVWDHVESVLCGARVASPTRAYDDAYAQHRQSLNAYLQHMVLPATTCGVAVEIDGALAGVDLFDQPTTFRKVWPRLIKGHALSALWPRPRTEISHDAWSFVDRMVTSKRETYPAVGLGSTIRLTSEGGEGAALLWGDQLIHVSLFARVPKPAVAGASGFASEKTVTQTGEPAACRRKRGAWRKFCAWLRSRR
jgi:hypothetical protein